MRFEEMHFVAIVAISALLTPPHPPTNASISSALQGVEGWVFHVTTVRACARHPLGVVGWVGHVTKSHNSARARASQGIRTTQGNTHDTGKYALHREYALHRQWRVLLVAVF